MSDRANDGTMPLSVQRAERELADLSGEIGRLEALIANKRERSIKLEHYLEMTREFASDTAEESEAPAGSAETRTEGRRPPPTRGKWSRVVQEAVAILRVRGEPTSAKELVSLLADRGIHIHTKTPDRALSQY